MRSVLPLLYALLAVISFASIHGQRRILQGKETWGYVTVRKSAHMFFWLYYTTADVDYKQRPLVLWLQGGPGASSTGIGNFLEIGPQDPDLKNRTNAWTEQVNILFLDNPVGSGYSYVDDVKLLPNNNTEVASDLVEFMKGFFKKVPEFQEVPLYIFAESYGGKMAAKFAQSLVKAVQQKKITCQVAGVALGDSWVSPVDAVLSWGPYLYSTSLVDSVGLTKVNTKTNAIDEAVKAAKWADATKLWSEAEELIENVTHGVNFYNILNHPSDGESNHVRQQSQYTFSLPHLVSSSSQSFPGYKGKQIHARSTRELRNPYKNSVLYSDTPMMKHIRDPSYKIYRKEEIIKGYNFNRKNKELKKNHIKLERVTKPNHMPMHLEQLYDRHVGVLSTVLDKLMNGPIRDKLKVIPQNVTWGGQSRQVFEALSADFMTSAVQNVEALLNSTAMKVVIYNGQLDLIVDTPGVEKWVEGMQWAGTGPWIKAERKAITDQTGANIAFSKSFKNFTFYWVLKAGHMVPADASDIALKMMKEIVGIKVR